MATPRMNRCVTNCVASCGDSIGEALGNVIEATLLYLNTVEELGERRRVFDERGIVFDRGLPLVDHGDDEAGKVAVEPGETVQRHSLALA